MAKSVIPGPLILEHRARLALACDPMIRSDAKGPHAQTNPSSRDRKRVRARIAPDRSPAAPAQRRRNTVCKSTRRNRSSSDERTGEDLKYSTVTSSPRKATEGNESYKLESLCAAHRFVTAATIRARPSGDRCRLLRPVFAGRSLLSGYSLPFQGRDFSIDCGGGPFGPPSRFPQCISNGKMIYLRV